MGSADERSTVMAIQYRKVRWTLLEEKPWVCSQVSTLPPGKRHTLVAICTTPVPDIYHEGAAGEVTIGQAWEMEKPYLLPLAERDYDCCVNKPVSLTPYSQVEFETNRYSVPAEKGYPNLVLKAYPFRVDILYGRDVLASHARCYGHNQEIFDPLHYLPLLEQRPGAFEHAKPIRRWRKQWPPVYEQLLARLKMEGRETRGSASLCRSCASRGLSGGPDRTGRGQALDYGCIHADGVKLCLRQLLNPAAIPSVRCPNRAAFPVGRPTGRPALLRAAVERVVSMENLLLETYLKQLRLPAFLRNYAKFAEDAAQANLSYDRYLLSLAEQEVAQRERNRQNARSRRPASRS